ncbi:MAG TPA: phospholipid carrier-dependent glycosyltransferase [Anaerolineales bacterium]|nr:phospholipid carrier-dependent glycosyltransferase [Anaerolineales bacterium]
MAIIKEFIRKIHAQQEKHKTWMDGLFLVLCVLYILSGIPLVPFHGDESAYIILSEDYDRVFKKHEVEKVLFDPDGPKQYLRLSTGAILSFSIGFARDITNNEDPINKWLWGASWDENLAKGNLPAPSLLNVARFSSAIMGALGTVLFFVLLRYLYPSRLAAWLATLAFVTQGSLLVSIRRAMQEGPKFLFLTLTTLLAFLIIQNLQTQKLRKGLYFALGIASGLTLAAKQDTAPVLVALYLTIAFIPVWNRTSFRAVWHTLLYLFAATLLAYATFLAFMPVFWQWWESVFVLTGLSVALFQIPFIHETRSKVLASAGLALVVVMTFVSPALWGKLHIPLSSMAELRQSIVGSQVEVSNGQDVLKADSAMGRLNFLLENTISSKVMYMEVDSFNVPPMQASIKAYEASFLSGRTGSFVFDGLIFLLALLGMWFLLRNFNSTSLLVYLLFFVTGTFLLVAIPLAWQRYFIIMQLPYMLFAGAGVYQLEMWLNPLFLEKKTASA